MLDYHQPLWRPPSEGDNLILQATLGCRFNRCSFCSMYKGKSYLERPVATVLAEAEAAARLWPQAHRVFLADGDAYGLPTEHLLELAAGLQQRLPRLQRLSAYATPFNLMTKTPEEIAALRQARLGLVYLGIESGAEQLLQAIGKGSAQHLERALARARESGLKVSATVILGLGGRALGEEHIAASAALINRQPPTYLSTLQLMLAPEVVPGFLERHQRVTGQPFEPADDLQVLAELRQLVALLAPPTPVIFRSNHASNALALAGTLPKDRGRLLAEIDAALAYAGALLRPSWQRGL